MPDVSGASRSGRELEFATRFCGPACIEFLRSLPHLLRRTIAYPALDKSKEHPMETPKYKNALIVGAGAGLSASLARLLAREGIKVALAARSIEKLGALAAEVGGAAFACDGSDPAAVHKLFAAVEARLGAPDLVV